MYLLKFQKQRIKDSVVNESLIRATLKSNFEGLRSSLSTIDLTLCIGHDNINDDWKSWRNPFLGAVSKYVPSKKLKRQKQLPFYT
jgi:hypothetical protein